MFGGGSSGSGGGGRRQQRPLFSGDGGGQGQEKSQEPPSKDDPTGLVMLGSSKFPDARAKHAWLILFFHGDMFYNDAKTKNYVSTARQISEGLLKKAKNKKNDTTFKVGAIDCSGGMKFCHAKLSHDGQGVEFPVFATVLNGNIRVITDAESRQGAKKLHDRITDSLLQIEGLVLNVNTAQDIESMLLESSPAPGHPGIAILLLTNKSKTSSLYASLAYRHRQDGFAAFGVSHRNKLQLRNKVFSADEGPLLLALIDNYERVEKYDGASFDSTSISNWLDELTKRYFKSKLSSDRRRKKHRA
jgi:hypothetical protein